MRKLFDAIKVFWRFTWPFILFAAFVGLGLLNGGGCGGSGGGAPTKVIKWRP
jgi:hypothetical protein